MNRFRKFHGSNLSFIDMLFNIIIVFVLLFFIALMLMNPPAKKQDIEAKADILIVMTWPDNNPHDIDLWVKPPEGRSIHYANRENSYIFLDRDDLGISNNFVIEGDKRIKIPTRREVVSFRGKAPGRYVANVQFYMAKTDMDKPNYGYDGSSVPVIVELIQINPSYKILARKEILLTAVREERTAFSFILKDDIITNIALDIEEPFILEK